MIRYELVSAESRLADVVVRLSRERRVAVDLESNGFFRYRERVCLVQLAAAETAFLVDPLAIDDPQPLGRLLADPLVEKIFHAPDYDLRSLDRDWGFRVNNLFDTGIAAALAGSTRLGLQSVLMEYAGVELVKPRKLQRSDWTIRPLSDVALDYAAQDVLHLPRVRESLSARLKELSRLEWAEEEFARMETVRHVPPDRELAFLSTRGSRDLDGRGLAILRSLSRFRDLRGQSPRPSALQGRPRLCAYPTLVRPHNQTLERERVGPLRASTRQQGTENGNRKRNQRPVP